MILAATGHRPNRLGGYSKSVHEKLLSLAHASLMELYPQQVISGMALGWDTAVAEAALYLDIPLIAAIPCEGQEKPWPKVCQAHYHEILQSASEVHMVTKGPYAPWVMEYRNRWMVDRATDILALWDGSSSGTGNTVHYAEASGKPIYNVWKKWSLM